MTLVKFFFGVTDKIFDKSQNEKEMLKFSDVDFEIQTDIAYGEGESCKLDTYVVKREGVYKYPVFFCIHGGGFVAGDKHGRRGLAKWAAEKGFFVVCVNYALAPEYRFPTGLVQLVQALNWVGENAEKYNLDLDNMCVSGDSAGGYYAAMLACVATNKTLQERYGVQTSLKFRTAMLDCGLYDLKEALGQKMPLNLTDRVLYDLCGVHVKELDGYEYADVLAPLDFVDESFPISFVTYAEKDMYCKGQGQKLIAKLQSFGVHVEEHHSTTYSDNHCYPLKWDKGAAVENIRLCDNFLRRVASKEV